MDKVKESLRRKLQTAGYYDQIEETKTQTERVSYEQAKLRGSIYEMLNHKLGIYKAQDQQAELDAMLDKLDIVAVTTELKGIDTKIEKVKNDHNAKLEKDKGDLKTKYEEKLLQFYRQGHMRGSIREAMIQDEYAIALRELESQEEKPSEELQALTDRRGLLTIAKETYMEQNSEVIEQMRKAQIVRDIEQSNLLDDIG